MKERLRMADMAILYARKSDPNARENDPSFEQQEAKCEDYAASMGYTVLDRIREAYTGTHLVKQDGLWRTTDAVENGRAQEVIAHSHDPLNPEYPVPTGLPLDNDPETDRA